MAGIPDNVALASEFVVAPAGIVWTLVADVGGWGRLFPGWTASVAVEDDRCSATGPNGERFDLYPQADDERLTLDVETVDELGSADTLRLRVLSAGGGCFVVVAHGRLTGMPEAEWASKRDAVAAGLRDIGTLL